MTSKHIIQLCNFSPALVLTLPPCYIHFPFLLQQKRYRKLYLISTWVKTLLNSWAFWHKSQTSASPKVKLKYEREKRKGGAGQKKLGCTAWQMQVTVELSEKVVTCVLHYSCICPSQSQSSDWFFCRLASKSVSCSIFFTNGKKEGKWMAICNSGPFVSLVLTQYCWTMMEYHLWNSRHQA